MAPEPDIDGVLAELTQTLRKFSVENRRVPTRMSELVGPRYLKRLPAPPPGKAFAIDAKNVRVYLK